MKSVLKYYMETETYICLTDRWGKVLGQIVQGFTKRPDFVAVKKITESYEDTWKIDGEVEVMDLTKADKVEYFTREEFIETFFEHLV